jgi:hypothetical protein
MRRFAAVRELGTLLLAGIGLLGLPGCHDDLDLPLVRPAPLIAVVVAVCVAIALGVRKRGP